MLALCLLITKYFSNKLFRIQNFQRRYDSVAVMLVFDAHGLEDFKGPGYHHPDKPAESPQDLECYPIAVSCPIVSDLSHFSCFLYVYKHEFLAFCVVPLYDNQQPGHSESSTRLSKVSSRK